MSGCPLMGWLGISLGLCQPRHTGGGSSGTLAAPVITQTSTTGATPFTWTTAEDATYQAGYFWNVQTATGASPAAASANLLAGTTNADVIQEIAPGDLTGDTITFTGLTTTSTAGPIALRERVGIDDGAGGYTWGAWSNVLTDTVASVNALVMVQEGDSITAWTTTGHADLWTAAHGSWTVHKQAAIGNGLADVIGRRATNRAYDAQIVTLLIGANDLTSTGLYPTATDYFNAVMAEVALYRADGAKVVVGTIMTQGSPQGTAHNPRRATYNTLLKAALGTQVDAIADYDATPLGQDAYADNPIYFIDYVHPTDGTGTPTSDGQELYMLPQYTAAVNYALGVANEVKQFTFTDNGAATASAATASNAITIIGLAYSETKAYSVSTGHDVRKNGGSWVTNGTGTVTSGDTLEVRATASATPGASVNVVLTVGTVTDTFTITTASAGLTTTYRSSGAGNGGFGSNFTFSSVSYYAGKNIIAVMTPFDGPTAVSLGGTSGTKVAEIVTSAGANRTTSFWEVSKGAGGSGNLVLTIATAYAVGYAMWSTDATATFATSQSKIYDYTPDPVQTPSITLPSGGSILVAAHSESPGVTLTPASGTTEDAEFADTGNWKFWAGQRSSTGQPGVNGFSGGGAQMLAVSYQP